MSKALLLDPRLAGISGDMLVAALVDLKGMEEVVGEVASTVEEVMGCGQLEARVEDVRRGELRAKSVRVLLAQGGRGHEAHSGREVMGFVRRCCELLGLSDAASRFALGVVRELVEAEAAVHGVEPNHVHLHELSSPDTVFDVACAATILDRMGVFRGGYVVYTTPPALGGGFVRCEHGLLPVPAPATLEILRRHMFRYSASSIPYELTTPTGAALLVSLVDEVVDYYPAMRVDGVGYGAGERELHEVPNVLRVVEGSRVKACEDRVVVLETNLDDVTGELVGHLVERLLAEGAIDVVVLPGLGKKNRPAHVVKVIAEPNDYMHLVDLLMREAGTLGVRVSEVSRVVALRRKVPVEVTVGGRKFTVTVKISRTPSGEVFRVKPEYEDLKAIAREVGLTLREVYEEVWRQLPATLREPSEE